VLLAEDGAAYLGTVPSKKRVQRICRAISEESGRNKTLLNQETVIATLNRMMIGVSQLFLSIELSSETLEHAKA